MGLAGVLDHEDSTVSAKREEGIHLDRSAVEVNRYHTSRPGSDRGLDDLGRDQCRLWIHVHRAWRGSDRTDRLGGGDEAIGGNDDLVTPANSKPAEGQLECGGAGGHPHRVLGTAPLSERALELRHLRSQGEGGTGADVLDDLKQFIVELGVGVVEAGERHGGGGTAVGAMRQDRGLCPAAHAVARSGGSPFVARATASPRAGSPSAKAAATSLRERTPNLVKIDER